MNDESPLLQRLASSIADGEAIDWGSVDRRLEGTPESRYARRLRLLARSSRVAPSSATSASRPLAPWMKGLAVFSLVQVAASLLTSPWVSFPAPPLLPITRRAVSGLLAATGVVLGVGGRRDRRASYLGLAYLALAAGICAALIHPAAGGGLLRLATCPIAECFLPLFLWEFSGRFPRVVRFNRLEPLMRAGIRATSRIGQVLAAGAVLSSLFPAGWFGFLSRDHQQGVFWIVLFLGTLPVLPVVGLRARDAAPEERTRVRWFAGGLAIGLGPPFLIVLADATTPTVTRILDQPGVTMATAVLVYACLLTLPLTTAYAVLARDVLDVRIALRRTLQHAIARSTLLAISAIPGLLLIRLLWVERQRPLVEIVAHGHGLGLGAAVAAALTLAALHRQLAAIVDRAFGHDGGDWAQALSRATSLLRSARSRQEVALIVREAAADAGRPRVVVYMVSSDWLRPIEGEPGPPLARNSALAALLSEGDLPLVIDPSDPRTVLPLLPEDERQWILDNDVALLTPLVRSDGTLVGAVSLTRPRSERSYGRRDRDLIVALCRAAAVAMDKMGSDGLTADDTGSDVERAGAECPTCGQISTAGTTLCSCGAATVNAALPAVVGGVFAVRRLLGRGGMGVVYLAEDRELGRSVALKTLPRLSAQAMVRLRREARAMATVTGPRLAAIHGMASWCGVPVLVVEYLAGGTLADRIAMRSRLPWAEVVDLGLALLEGVEAMHCRGLLHRDLKPSNIGFAADGTAKILDFGLAALAESQDWPSETKIGPEGTRTLTSTGHVVGTVLYLSPERLAGTAPQPADDLWALSITLYESLTGRHPWREQEQSQAGRSPIPAPSMLAVRIPAEADRFFSAALAIDVDQRARKASELRALLQSQISV